MSNKIIVTVGILAVVMLVMTVPIVRAQEVNYVKIWKQTLAAAAPYQRQQMYKDPKLASDPTFQAAKKSFELDQLLENTSQKVLGHSFRLTN